MTRFSKDLALPSDCHIESMKPEVFQRKLFYKGKFYSSTFSKFKVKQGFKIDVVVKIINKRTGDTFTFYENNISEFTWLTQIGEKEKIAKAIYKALFSMKKEQDLMEKFNKKR